jgi:hypothetical protein
MKEDEEGQGEYAEGLRKPTSVEGRGALLSDTLSVVARGAKEPHGRHFLENDCAVKADQ